jgi:hypothetical protein
MGEIRRMRVDWAGKLLLVSHSDSYMLVERADGLCCSISAASSPPRRNVANRTDRNNGQQVMLTRSKQQVGSYRIDARPRLQSIRIGRGERREHASALYDLQDRNLTFLQPEVKLQEQAEVSIFLSLASLSSGSDVELC